MPVALPILWGPFSENSSVYQNNTVPSLKKSLSQFGVNGLNTALISTLWMNRNAHCELDLTNAPMS